ncbi:MAG: universal stress protein [Dehalococcoidia bacterium]|nr:universal stress protein [Dehalococcoidia bacterium]
MRGPEVLQGKILFPWDGSPLAERSLVFGTALARLLGTELVIFHVRLPIRASLVAAPEFRPRDRRRVPASETWAKTIVHFLVPCGFPQAGAHTPGYDLPAALHTGRHAGAHQPSHSIGAMS